jgi:energy-coupling factor transporter ATP-binding protein EcfA2
VESLIQEGDEYADRHEMISLQVELFGSSIEMRIPQSDDTLPISLSQGFMRSTRAASGEADFIITCIDDSIGDRRTQAYFEKDWHLPLGLIDRQLTGDRRVAIDRHSQTVSVFDPRTRRCVVWTKLLADLPYWSAATPFRLQLSWICDVVGLEFLHSAAVSSFGKATLFAGPSGSGKSTIALLLAQLGFPLIADDFLVASPDAVQGVYTRVKVHDNYLRQTVNEDWKILNPEAISQKRIVETIDAITDEVIPIRCIIVPTIGQELGLEPLDAGDALSAIAPASLSGLLGGNDRSLNRIATLVSAFPCFRLGLDQSVFTDERGSRRIVEELQKLVS